MAGKSPFVGRTVAVVNDLSPDEQIYLYERTRELKDAIQSGGAADALERFKLQDADVSVYLFFMEDSTRTKESFRNAAKFHQVKVNDFDSHSSSLSKKESISDTIRMLLGYSHRQSVFIVRSKLEGVCRALEGPMAEHASKMGIPPPSFLNAGDGRHEHPTQEFLDEFSFLEQKQWDRSAIHLALVGDLFHGRTVHSKVDGLQIYGKVEVDLVAPDDIGMPEEYVARMEERGYVIRKFPSIEAYLADGHVARIWYFTRLQLERMGDKIRDKEAQLRVAVTFREEWIERVHPDTRFYHPLPRHSEFPTIPTFLDSTPLNNWDRQAMNGYFVRIILLAMVAGRLGGPSSPAPFTGKPPVVPSFNEQFVEELQVQDSGSERKGDKVKNYAIKPIEDGIVIDHVAVGPDVRHVWETIEKARKILALNVVSSHGVYPSSKPRLAADGGDDGVTKLYKGVLSLPHVGPFAGAELKRLAAIAPGCTLNVIQGGRVQRKYRLHMPPRIYNFRDISCKNDCCITSPKLFENLVPCFFRFSKGTVPSFTCRYCEKVHAYQDIWL
eukprot:TRINITY_DN2573_c0_g2_i1.p1 TRINITY_DN2573_c0_g2~~TRINITY_DN2573_c0_g2_i1.p1  ORF type:complete len:554 (+),score=98.27 TRINITY_DN2573_c0_g2_i1:102-1763(+)